MNAVPKIDLVIDVIPEEDKKEGTTSVVPLPAAPTLEQIQRFESLLRTFPQLAIETRHYHAKGLYARLIYIPADTFLTGKLHKEEHIAVMLAGDITVWHEGRMQRMTGQHVLISPPGTKRAAYAHAETLWLTVHAADETDLVKLEELLIIPEPKLGLESEPIKLEGDCL